MRTFDDLVSAQSDWRELALAADNIFSTWEWADCWWRHFGRGSLAISAVENGAGRPLALLPLYSERRKGLRLARFVGHGVADQLGPLCAPCDVQVASDALVVATDRDVLIAERLPGERDWRRLGGQLLHEDPSPVIEFDTGTGWEGYVASRSAKLRRDIRRRERRLSELGVSFRLVEDPESLERDMDALFDLHAKRWGTETSAFAGARENFHREFARIALERGWLRLLIAEVAGQPVAASYGFRFGDAEYSYQQGRDPEWARSGVGAGLYEQSIRAAFAAGMREFRMLRGDEAYKQRYATATRVVVTIAIPLSARGRAAVSAASVLAHSARGRQLLRRVTD